MPTEKIKEEITVFYRQTLSLLVEKTSEFKAILLAADELEGQNKEEMIANVTLALRHIEDASMRFGKVIQASAGGVSPLGGPATPAK